VTRGLHVMELCDVHVHDVLCVSSTVDVHVHVMWRAAMHVYAGVESCSL